MTDRGPRFPAAHWLALVLVMAIGCGGDDDVGELSTDQVAVMNAGITAWRSIDAALLANTAALDFGVGPPRSTLLSPAHEYGLACPDLTVGVMLTELQILVDYGDDGCISDLSGQEHSGLAELVVSLGETTGTLTANSLTTGDYRVDGIIGATYLDTTVTIDARDVTVMSPDGNVMLTSCLGITWSKGGNRLLLSDDSWRIEGTAVVSTLDFKSGATYDLEVVPGKELIVNSQCRWPVSGSLTIERREPPLTARLDFGEGACDAMATVTVAGRSQVVDLGSR